MTKRRTIVVVDGSNLATEGRTTPSLRQLDESVTAFLEERPDADVVVVVDATFEHRVATAERERVKEAELSGEIVTPPAGAIGRGDAFILKIAKRAGAVVLSNDSFQEFHAEHPWLFEEGRLIGGKPVPKIGWIFTPRTPVRGQKSKAVTKKAARAAAASDQDASDADTPRIGDVRPAPRARTSAKVVDDVLAVPKTRATRKRVDEETPAVRPAKAAAKRSGTKAATKAVATSPEPAKRAAATPKAAQGRVAKQPAKQAVKRSSRVSPPPEPEPEPAPEPVRARPGRRAAKAPTPPAAAAPAGRTAEAKAPAATGRTEPVNTPRAFARLAAEHSVGESVEGEVVQFTSHGAMVSVRAGRTMHVICYAPLAGLGSPPPTRARDVLKKGERHQFRIVGFDESRRRAELALAST